MSTIDSNVEIKVDCLFTKRCAQDHEGMFGVFPEQTLTMQNNKLENENKCPALPFPMTVNDRYSYHIDNTTRKNDWREKMTLRKNDVAVFNSI